VAGWLIRPWRSCRGRTSGDRQGGWSSMCRWQSSRSTRIKLWALVSFESKATLASFRRDTIW